MKLYLVSARAKKKCQENVLSFLLFYVQSFLLVYSMIYCLFHEIFSLEKKIEIKTRRGQKVIADHLV